MELRVTSSACSGHVVVTIIGTLLCGKMCLGSYLVSCDFPSLVLALNLI